MSAHKHSGYFLMLAVFAAVLLTACNQEASDSAPSEVPASAPVDSSASG